MVPSGTDFFTRLLRQVGYPAAIFCLPLTEPCGRGPDIHGPTQVPYYEMWVKIRASRTPQDAIFGTALIIAEPRPLVKRAVAVYFTRLARKIRPETPRYQKI